MGATILKAVLSAMNWQQLVTFLLMTVAPMLIKMAPVALQDPLNAVIQPLLALLLVLVRKPSTQGGAVSTAIKK